MPSRIRRSIELAGSPFRSRSDPRCADADHEGHASNVHWGGALHIALGDGDADSGSVGPVLAGAGGVERRDVWRKVATVVVYMAVGVLFYSLVLPEAFTFVDSLYFTMTTLTTVGYGDLTPTSQSGRAFTSIYALCGVALIGNILSYFGEKVADQRAASIKETANKNDARFVEMLSQRRASARLLANGDATSQMQLFLQTATEDGLRYTTFLRDNWVFLPLLILFSLGSYAEISQDQGGTFIDAMYYTVATLTTVGYGDFSPNDQLTRGLAVILVPLSTISMAILIGRFAEFQVRKRELVQRSEELERGFTREDLVLMDKNKDGRVSRREFMFFMLISSGKATQVYLDRLNKLFDELDDDGSGYLDENDLLTRIDRSNEELSRGATDGRRRHSGRSPYRPARRPGPRRDGDSDGSDVVPRRHDDARAQDGVGDGRRHDRPRRGDSTERPARRPRPRLDDSDRSDVVPGRHDNARAQDSAENGRRHERSRRSDSTDRRTRRDGPPRRSNRDLQSSLRRSAKGERNLKPANHSRRRPAEQRQGGEEDRGRSRSNTGNRGGSLEKRRRHSRD